MKKKWLIIGIIFILMIIPIPTGIYKDGGTRTYTALTYKIVDWNHIYGEEGAIYDALKIYPFPMNFMSLDTLFYREEKMLASVGKLEEEKQTEEIVKTGELFPIPFEAQYIRTNGYHENVEYPIVKVIRSVEELQSYYEENKDSYYLERNETFHNREKKEIQQNNRRDSLAEIIRFETKEGMPGFLDACDKYDSAYFEEKILILVVLEENSGSIRHRVEEIREMDEKQIEIEITSLSPEDHTDDMAEWHILLEVNADVIEDASDIDVFWYGKSMKNKPTIVSYSKGYANMSLELPKGWTYEMYDGEAGFGICFWPKNQKEGKIRLEYFEYGFAVCGTGLEEKKITLNGYEANQGTYDDRDVWDFISFKDTAGDYAIINEGSIWWEEYGKEAMKILATIKVGENIIGKEEAIAIAKKIVTIEYNQVRADFDYEKGFWEVMFSKYHTAGGDQVVIIDTNGNMMETVYGE